MAITRAGKSAYMAWTPDGGAEIVLSGLKWRAFSYNDTGALIDITAGSEDYRTRIASIKDASGSYTWEYDDTTGAATATALVAGQDGVMVIGFEGDDTGKESITVPMISQGVSTNFPYDGIKECSVEFAGNGAPVKDTFA